VFAYLDDRLALSVSSTKVTVNDGNQTAWITDGNPISCRSKKGDKSCYIGKPFAAEK
jgi:hypothetical protein